MDTMTELLSIPSVSQMLKENDRRNEIIYATFNPITGQGSIGRRIRIEISDFILPVQWIPQSMMKIEFVQRLVEAGSIRKFLSDALMVGYSDTDASKVSQQFIRLRYRHDFPFWCATLVKVKKKGAVTTFSSGYGIHSDDSSRCLRKAAWQTSLSA